MPFENSDSGTSLDIMPNEVLLNIFGHLSGEQLAKISPVSRTWDNIILNENKLWKDRLLANTTLTEKEFDTSFVLPCIKSLYEIWSDLHDICKDELVDKAVRDPIVAMLVVTTDSLVSQLNFNELMRICYGNTLACYRTDATCSKQKIYELIDEYNIILIDAKCYTIHGDKEESLGLILGFKNNNGQYNIKALRPNHCGVFNSNIIKSQIEFENYFDVFQIVAPSVVNRVINIIKPYASDKELISNLNAARAFFNRPELLENYADDYDDDWSLIFAKSDTEIGKLILKTDFLFKRIIERGDPHEDIISLALGNLELAALILSEQKFIQYIDSHCLVEIARASGDVWYEVGYYDLVLNNILQTDLVYIINGEDLVDVGIVNIDYAKVILANPELVSRMSSDDLYNLAVHSNGEEWAKLVLSDDSLFSRLDTQVRDINDIIVNQIDLICQVYGNPPELIEIVEKHRALASCQNLFGM